MAMVLPVEIYQLIFDFVGPQSIFTTKFVCKEWYNVHKCQICPPAKYLVDKDNTHLLEWASNQGCFIDKSVCEYCGVYGYINVIIWLDEQPDRKVGFDAFVLQSNAAQCGHLNILQWVMKNKMHDFSPWTICLGAGKGGLVPMLEWVRERGFHVQTCVVPAVENKQKDAIIWLYNNVNIDKDLIIRTAVDSNDADFLDWIFHRTICVLNGVLFRIAIRSGHFNSLEWLRKMDCPWDEFSYDDICEKGDVEVLQWARKNQLPGDVNHHTVAKRGHYGMLQWIHGNIPTVVFDEYTLFLAVASQNTNMIEWLYQLGCGLIETACYKAAKKENILILMWLRERGCPWDGRVRRVCMRKQNEEILEWAIINGAPRAK